jgi:uncharacterized glyoxalase superfamily protein PhnB
MRWPTREFFLKGGAMNEKQIVGGAPIFLVEDVNHTVRYYEERLGFCTEFLHGEPATYGTVESGTFSLHFALSVPGAGRSNRSENSPLANDVYVFVKDADALHAELVERGAEVLNQPQTWPYQMREFSVRDCNGYHLCFGQFVGEGQD